MTDTSELSVCIVFGGPGAERDGSALSAGHVASALAGRVAAIDVVDLADADVRDRIAAADVVFNAGHGLIAEDGVFQGFCEVVGTPYTGSGVRASAICMHKATFKALLVAAGLPTAPWAVLPTGASEEQVRTALARLDGPWFVKPVAGGESFGAGVARSVAEVLSLLGAGAAGEYTDYLVEPLLDGSTYTVGIHDEDATPRTLPVLEARSANEFYDAEAKQDANFRTYLCPAPLSPDVTTLVQDIALRAYRLAGCEGLARVDLMVHDGRPLVLEVNTVPGFSEQGNLAEMVRRSGRDFGDVLVAELAGALRRDRSRPLAVARCR